MLQFYSAAVSKVKSNMFNVKIPTLKYYVYADALVVNVCHNAFVTKAQSYIIIKIWHE